MDTPWPGQPAAGTLAASAWKCQPRFPVVHVCSWHSPPSLWHRPHRAPVVLATLLKHGPPCHATCAAYKGRAWLRAGAMVDPSVLLSCGRD